jgi:hypothetical protein
MKLVKKAYRDFDELTDGQDNSVQFKKQGGNYLVRYVNSNSYQDKDIMKFLPVTGETRFASRYYYTYDKNLNTTKLNQVQFEKLLSAIDKGKKAYAKSFADFYSDRVADGVENMKLKNILEDKKKGADGKACWDGYRYAGTEDGKDKCVKVDEALRLEIWEHGQPVLWQEAEYQGRKVKLGKPQRTGKDESGKFKVYVKDPKTGNVKVVRFGHQGKGNEKTMTIKKNNPERRKSFRARHNCDNPGPKTKARYWSCRAW